MTMQKKHLTNIQALAVSTIGAALMVFSGGAMAAWPEKPVTIIVPAGAGGGTDATARMISSRLEQKFKQPFNVVNMGEGGGIVGITKFATARPDGYTLGILYNYAHYKEMGQTTLTLKNLTPIAQYNFDRKAKSSMTVSEWKQRRFNPTYPGYSCRVLNGDGSEAHGNAKLVSVRESYEE